MILLAGLLEVLLRAAVLAGLALAAGGVVFGLAVLRPLRDLPASAADRALRLVAAGGGAVLAFELATLLVAPWALADELGRWPVAQFLGTRFARAGIANAAAGGVVALLAWRGRPRAGRPPRWAPVTAGAALLALTGAPLVHGASRLEGAAALTTFTVLHQLGAAAWAGGLAHLLVQRARRGDGPGAGAAWAAMVTRFSRLAATAVAAIVATGTFLALRYVASGGALVGTAYGAMVITKVALMGAALLLALGNLLAARRWRRGGGGAAAEAPQVAIRVEGESFVVIAILLAAAALTSQPPAVDVAERASPAEAAAVFAPKLPRLAPPPYREMVASAAASLDPFAEPGAFDRDQSDFNHNVAGLFVLVTALGALLHRTGKVPAARHWPLALLGLAAFLLVLAEPNGWPFGPEGFFETLLAPSVLTHRLATALVAALAVFEWRVQAGALRGTRWAYAFPALAGLGGVLLLTHSHSATATRWAFLIELSHNAIGLLAVLIAVGRWLELRSPEPAWRRAAGLLWPACMALVGLVLVFYREL